MAFFGYHLADGTLIITSVISLDVTSEVHCQVLYTFNQIAGNAAMGLASINLSIRTFVASFVIFGW